MMRFSILAPQIGAILGASLIVVAGLSAQNKTADHDDPAIELENVPGPYVLEPISVDWSTRLNQTVKSALASSKPAPEASIEVDQSQPVLAVIIDDVGLDLKTAEHLLSLDIPLTLSILPYAEAAPLIADAGRMLGKDVFLHLPMEPVGNEDPGPNALYVDMDEDAVARRIYDALERVPGASGFNNHMGSRMTTDMDSMQSVFNALKSQWSSLIFVDSVTHPRTQAAQIGQLSGFQAFRRDIFLDHDDGGQNARDQLQKALKLANEQGSVIVIGHPYRETLAALEDLEQMAAEEGVRLLTMLDYARWAKNRPVSG